MDKKVKPKFLLPPPKFDKPKGPPNASAPYLTPSGMTLLPRAKQPPPMYGARGSTVPAKYLSREQKISISVPDTPPVYQTPARPEPCYTCDIELSNSQDMKRHLEQHEDCPAEGCDFSALHNILERHIEANHITGAYKRVKKVWTAEELSAWRAERRKKSVTSIHKIRNNLYLLLIYLRFPTAANVELARLSKEQRIKRGERLEASKSRFGQREDRQRTRGDRTERFKPNNQRKRKCRNQPIDKKKTERKPSKVCDEKAGEIRATVEKSECQVKDKQTRENIRSVGLQKFRGTDEMPDYKHFKDKVQKEDNALFGLVGMYGSDSEQDSEWEREQLEQQEYPTAKLNNENMQGKEIGKSDTPRHADRITDLGSSEPIGNKLWESFKAVQAPANAVTCEDPSYALDNSSSQKEPIQRISESEAEPTFPSLENALSSDEEPVEEPIQRFTETIDETALRLCTVAKVAKPEPPTKRPHPKRVYGLNYKRARMVSQQNTMLSKLLAADIRHERNVLLQCVRYVCQNQFFGIGQPR
ncbi:hypothetical protein KR009_004553 [Drosophila setifemur]|nr:hypothetical protein KR009_004553 [Drosophila setifemur]